MAMQLSRPKRMKRDDAHDVVESVSIRQSENGGFVLRVEYRPKDAPKSGRGALCGPCYVPSKEYTFEDWSKANAFIGKAFGGK